MVKNNYLSSFINIHHHHIPLLTLCGKSVKQSHCPWAAEWFKSSFLTLQGKPNTHAWGPSHHTTFPLSFRVVDQSHPPPRVQVPHATVRRRVVPTHVLAICIWDQSSRGGGYVHLPGQSGTELPDYHILGMRLCDILCVWKIINSHIRIMRRGNMRTNN